MEFSRVIYNGELVDFKSLLTRGEGLLSELYLYQNIHILDLKPLFLEQHLALIKRNYKIFFSREFNTERFGELIEKLLKENACAMGSYVVRLYLWRNSFMITVCERLVYSGFTIWHTRPSARVIKCENPFTGMATSVSLMSSNYALGMDKDSVCLCANLDNMITGVGDAPVFCVKDMEVFTTPLSFGVSESVEREIAINAIKKLGLSLNQRPVLVDELESFDEIFYVNTQGTVSLKDYKGKMFLSVIAQRVADSCGR